MNKENASSEAKNTINRTQNIIHCIYYIKYYESVKTKYINHINIGHINNCEWASITYEKKPIFNLA